MLTELLLLVLLALAWSLLVSRRRREKRNLPPGPFMFPLVGNLAQLISLSHRSLGELSRRHGPLMRLQVGRAVVVVASSAEAAREIMKTHDLVFASRPLLTATKKLIYGCKDVIFAPYGEEWRQARRICVHHLLSARRVQSYRSVREDEVALFMGEISRQSTSPSGTPVDLTAMIRTFMSGLVSRVALGRKYPERWQLISEGIAILGELFVEDFFPELAWVSKMMGKHDRLGKCFRETDSFFDEVIADHVRSHRPVGEDDEDGRDLVDVLLDLQKDEDADNFLTRDRIKAIILDMFGAGTEDPANAFEWTMSELVRNPAVMRKAQEEVRTTVGNKSMVAEDDLHQLNYMKAVIKEAMRLHPPAPLLIQRESVGDTKIFGFDIPAGAWVLVNVWVIGRDPRNWDSPDEFNPVRFLDASAVDYKGQDFHYLPFGAGRRMCPGIAFATTTIELLLANLLHQFDWKLPKGMSLKELDMTEVAGIAMPRKTRLRLVPIPKDMKG